MCELFLNETVTYIWFWEFGLNLDYLFVFGLFQSEYSVMQTFITMRIFNLCLSVCRLTLHWLALLGIGKNWYNMMPFCLYFLLDSFFKNLNVILIFKPKVAYCCNYITRIMCLFSGAQIWFRNCFSFILPYSLHLMAT